MVERRDPEGVTDEDFVTWYARSDKQRREILQSYLAFVIIIYSRGGGRLGEVDYLDGNTGRPGRLRHLMEVFTQPYGETPDGLIRDPESHTG